MIFNRTTGKNQKLSDKSVLLLDGAPANRPRISSDIYSNRVFAINRGTVKLLRQIGAWDTIESLRFQPVKQMQVCFKYICIIFTTIILFLLGLGCMFGRNNNIQR